MESCIFSFYISESDLEIENLINKNNFGKYTVLTDAKTPYLYACNKNKECVIFGYAVHVFTGESETLVNKIVSCCSNISEVIDFEKSLGGKYLILYRDKEQYYVLGDATCSIPIFYNENEEFACSSNMNYIVAQYGYLPDLNLYSIRKACDISQAMPYDITQYSEIKQLIPNHYILVNERKAIRFINSHQSQAPLSVEDVTELTVPLIETMYEYYKKKFKLYCPITSGRDSRVVLAFMANKGDNVQCYTIKHLEYREDSQDVLIPKTLCMKNKIPYEQIYDVKVSENVKTEIDYLLGKNLYSLKTLCIAQTINKHYGDGAIINGDIIGQVGKCSLHRDISECFAVPSYFQCKLHNYSSESKIHLKLWLKEIQNKGECINNFDLFSIENRMGRWAGQENLIYNSIGQIYLNIFNSRSIIYLWTAVSRKDRKNSSIHTSLIKKKMPELLTIPFESDDSMLVRISKTNGMAFLVSSYIKHYIEWAKFKKGK